MPEIVYTDTLILGTLSLSEFSISIGIRLLFGENHFRFNFTADLQNSERKKSKKDKKNLVIVNTVHAKVRLLRATGLDFE